ncbi:hypothetical protein ACFL0W_00425 [Nanoarchaeota archaeon]
MKELFTALQHKFMNEVKKKPFFDTCFFFYMFEHKKELERAEKMKEIYLTSFNVQEILYKEDNVGHNIKHEIRKFLKDNKDKIKVVDVDVFPGNVEREKEFVNNIDENILKHIEDASDAVLLAIAIKTESTIYTRDKHHLFNADLENYVNEKGVKVLNTIE